VAGQGVLYDYILLQQHKDAVHIANLQGLKRLNVALPCKTPGWQSAELGCLSRLVNLEDLGLVFGECVPRKFDCWMWQLPDTAVQPTVACCMQDLVYWTASSLRCSGMRMKLPAVTCSLEHPQEAPAAILLVLL
jgi:hypothetical protein